MSSFIGILLLGLVAGGMASTGFARDLANSIPKYPYDPNTTKQCTWWLDSDGLLGCEEIQNLYGVSLVDFMSWNPSVHENCGKLPSDTSFCLAASPSPRPRPSRTSSTVNIPSTTTISITISAPTSSVPITPSTTTVKVTISLTTVVTTTATPSVVTSVVTLPKPSPSETRPFNGVNTPSPYQDGMVDNCSAFYFTRKGDTCVDVSASHGISVQDFVSWNPGVGGVACHTLWADTYVCVNILGRPPTRTRVENGVNTPVPIQDGMTDRCKSFYFVTQGDTCDGIVAKYGISTQALVDWNPGVKSDCTGLWAGTFCCVGIL